MTTKLDEKVAVLNAVELDLNIEGPRFGVVANHNETMVSDLELELEAFKKFEELEWLEELEAKTALSGIIVTGPTGGLRH